MSTLEQAARQALNALGWHYQQRHEIADSRIAVDRQAISDLVAALAQQQAEPVAVCFCGDPTILNIWHRKDGPCFAPQMAEPVEMQYIALCDAMRYSERKDELFSPEEHAESLVAEIDRLKQQAEPVQAEPVTTEQGMDIELTDEDLVLLSDALQAQIHAFGTEAAQTAHEEDQGALIRHAQAFEALKDKLDTCVAGTYAVISRVRILF
jgi:hypothetical protein